MNVCSECVAKLLKLIYQGLLHTEYIQDSNNIITQKMSLGDLDQLYNK